MEESPFQIFASFDKYLQVLQAIRDSDTQEYRATYAASVLSNMSGIPELMGDFNDFSLLEKHADLIHLLLADLFPTGLTFNEIKAASIPLSSFTFNYTERFKKIMEDAGENFSIGFRKISHEELYVYSCCLILQVYFGRGTKVSPPFYFDIPSKQGVIKHYKITVNSDYTEIRPADGAIFPDDDTISMLLENMDDIRLWKKYFPPGSWILSGFNIITLVDTTFEVALSDLKSTLIEVDLENPKPNNNLKEIFRSYFDAPQLSFGLMLFNSRNNTLEKIKIYENIFTNHILDFWMGMFDKKTRQSAFRNIEYNSKPIIVSNVDNLDAEIKEQPAFRILEKNNIRSFMIVPVIKDKQLLAILEFTSPVTDSLDGLKLKKLEFIFDIIFYTLNRFNFEKQNQIEAIIQQEYTAIHESVAWKFRLEAEKKYNAMLAGQKYSPRQITFSGLIPLFGQTDIRSSSDKRTEGLKEDLLEQTDLLLEIFSVAPAEISEEYTLALDIFRDEIRNHLRADTEHRFQHFIGKEITPQLQILAQDEDARLQELLKEYTQSTFRHNGIFYRKRRLLDESISMINRQLAEILEQKQKEAQKIFPHYFEMFKSDGVEYNLFIGKSIDPGRKFSKKMIYRLKCWQLETTIAMEKSTANSSSRLPFPLETASLIFIYNDAIEIRFRMDEKGFDVDGAYNSYYEIIKKRLEKAYVKNTGERLTQPGKIAIVYPDSDTGKEYQEVISEYQGKGLLAAETELLEVEDLQGVNGLQAIRVQPL